MLIKKGIPEILGSAFFSATVINTVIFVKNIFMCGCIFNKIVYNNIKENCTLKSTQAT